MPGQRPPPRYPESRPNYGVYPMKPAPPAAAFFRLLFGTDALHASCHHDTHHANPRVAARQLPGVAGEPPAV